MFGKKKREAEARAAAEARALAEARAKAAKAKKGPTASWKRVSSGPVPVARPSDNIQLTPIVQPIPLVPYSTQLQPLAMYDDGLEDDYE